MVARQSKLGNAPTVATRPMIWAASLGGLRRVLDPIPIPPSHDFSLGVEAMMQQGGYARVITFGDDAASTAVEVWQNEDDAERSLVAIRIGESIKTVLCQDTPSLLACLERVESILRLGRDFAVED